MVNDYEFRGVKGLLKEIGLYNKIIEKLGRLDSINESSEGYEKEFDSKDDWEKHYALKQIVDPTFPFDWHFDSYNKKQNIAIEFEKGPQTQARWDWVKFQLGKVDVGILVIEEGSDATVDRVRKELKSRVFEDIINIDVPIYVIEWSKKRS